MSKSTTSNWEARTGPHRRCSHQARRAPRPARNESPLVEKLLDADGWRTAARPLLRRGSYGGLWKPVPARPRDPSLIWTRRNPASTATSSAGSPIRRHFGDRRAPDDRAAVDRRFPLAFALGPLEDEGFLCACAARTACTTELVASRPDACPVSDGSSLAAARGAPVMSSAIRGSASICRMRGFPRSPKTCAVRSPTGARLLWPTSTRTRTNRNGRRLPPSVLRATFRPDRCIPGGLRHDGRGWLASRMGDF